jgi:hypothetical protein
VPVAVGDGALVGVELGGAVAVGVDGGTGVEVAEAGPVTGVAAAGGRVEVTVGPDVQPTTHPKSASKGAAIRIHRTAFAFMVPTLWARVGP